MLEIDNFLLIVRKLNDFKKEVYVKVCIIDEKRYFGGFIFFLIYYIVIYYLFVKYLKNRISKLIYVLNNNVFFDSSNGI